MKIKLKSVQVVLAAVVTMGLELNIHAVTRYLAPSPADQTATFQSLVNQSVSGDIIIVQAGDHYLCGTVYLTVGGITVRGDNSNAIRKCGQMACFDITAPSAITMDNIYIDGGNRAEPCVRVFSSGNIIQNCTFRNSAHSGLLIHNSNLNQILSCKVFYNGLVGISQYNSCDNTINNCQVYENGAEGITIDVGSHNSRVYYNWIHRNNLPHAGVGGIGIDASNGAWIQYNTIDYNGFDGIKFQNNICCGCDGVRIWNNYNISFNEGCAVKIRQTYPVTNLGFSGNTCTGNGGGNGICYQ